MRRWNAEMREILAVQTGRPRLLLHACCAPCSSSVVERLAPHFDLTVYFYNPNIAPPEEYRRRAEEERRFLARLGIPLIEEPYSPQDFAPLAERFGDEPERGARCRACYALRLFRAAEFARANGFPWLCSTLSVSPHKNADWVNELGEEAAGRAGVRWLPSDFKKENGYLRSLALSKEYGLYRQSWCGCEFSYRESRKRAEKEG